MKTCELCGCVNDSINKFCRNCGSKFPVIDPVSAPETVKSPETEKTEEEYIDFDFREEDFEDFDDEIADEGIPEIRYSTHPNIDLLKKTARGVPFVCFSIFGFLSLAAGFLSLTIERLSESVVPFLYDKFGFNCGIGDYRFINTAAYFTMLLALVSTIGAFCFSLSANNRRKNSVSTKGLSVLKGISLFFAIGVFAVGTVGCVFLSVIIPLYSYDRANLFFHNSVNVFTLAIFIFSFINMFSIRGIVDKIQKIARTGITDSKISVFPAVMNIIYIIMLAPVIGYAFALSKYFMAASVMFNMISLACMSSAIWSLSHISKSMIYSAKSNEIISKHGSVSDDN